MLLLLAILACWVAVSVGAATAFALAHRRRPRARQQVRIIHLRDDMSRSENDDVHSKVNAVM